MHRFLSRWAPFIAFLVLAVGGILALNAENRSQATTLYHSQLAACSRGNDLRRLLNFQFSSNQVQIKVLKNFLQAAREARLSSFKETGSRSDQIAAKQYLISLDALASGPVAKSLPLISCHKAILKP